MISDELRERIRKQYYFHKIPLEPGFSTPGHDITDKIKAAHLPGDMRGLTVLDVGCWDGGLSFECERRGATRVLATDHFVWNVYGRGGFDLAHEALNSVVESKDIRVEDIRPETVGMWDVVLFLGVLYHAQNPMLYLERLASVTLERAIIETHIDAIDYPRPAAVFYPGSTLNHDPTNFWGPNPACVVAMLKEVGFASVKEFPEWYPSRRVFHAIKP